MAIKANFPVIRPSLNLDFSNSKVLDPRITFIRASTATYFGADGLLKTAAAGEPRFDHDPLTGECKGLLIEEARTNLLTYSEQFDNAAWLKTYTTITPNTTTAPNGTVTADAFIEGNNTNPHFLSQTKYFVAGTSYTISIFAKEIPGSAKRYIALVFPSAIFGANVRTTFDLSDGTLYNTNSPVTSTCVPVGNGWYRCSVTMTCVTSGSTGWQVRLSPNKPDTLSSYTGDGVSGIYVWGAQLEAGAFPTSYIPSADSFTSRASAASFIGSNGLIQSASTNVARMQYNPLNLSLVPNLLLEEARTNLLTYSEQFDNAAWERAGTTISPNTTTAPDGTTTADKIVETTASSGHNFRRMYTFAASTAYTVSYFVKADERSAFTFLVFDGASAAAAWAVNLATREIVQTNSVLPSTCMIQALANGWYRVAVSFTSTSAPSGSYFDLCLSDRWIPVDLGQLYTGDGVSGLYLWGAQLEAGAFPTSYIATTSAQVTRAADVSTSAQATRAADLALMTGENFSSWYRQDEGSFVVDWTAGGKVTNAEIVSVSDGSTSNSMQPARYSSGGLLQYTCVVGGVAQWSIAQNGYNTAGSRHRTAVGYKSNDIAQTADGVLTGVDTSANVPAVTRMDIGMMYSGGNNVCGHIAHLTYYPKRLPNTLLQDLSR